MLVYFAWLIAIPLAFLFFSDGGAALGWGWDLSWGLVPASVVLLWFLWMARMGSKTPRHPDPLRRPDQRVWAGFCQTCGARGLTVANPCTTCAPPK